MDLLSKQRIISESYVLASDNIPESFIQIEMLYLNATINNILVGEKEGVTATLVYMRDGTDEAKSVEFTPNDVAAALILYCSTRQIPLPRDAKKVVVPIEDSVGMIIKIDT